MVEILGALSRGDLFRIAALVPVAVAVGSNVSCSLLPRLGEQLDLEEQRKQTAVGIGESLVGRGYTLKSVNLFPDYTNPLLQAVISTGSVEFLDKMGNEPSLIFRFDSTFYNGKLTSAYLRIDDGLYQKSARSAGVNPRDPTAAQLIPVSELRSVSHALLNPEGKTTREWDTTVSYGRGQIPALAFERKVEGKQQIWGYLDVQGEGRILWVPADTNTAWIDPEKFTTETLKTAELLLTEKYLAQKELVPANPLDNKTGLPVHLTDRAYEMRIDVVREGLTWVRNPDRQLSIVNSFGKVGKETVESILKADFRILDGATNIIGGSSLRPGVSNRDFFNFIRTRLPEVFNLTPDGMAGVQDWNEGVENIGLGRPFSRIVNQNGVLLAEVNPSEISIFYRRK